MNDSYNVPCDDDGNEIVGGGGPRSLGEMDELERAIIIATGGRGQLTVAQRKRLSMRFIWPDPAKKAIGGEIKSDVSPIYLFQQNDTYRAYVQASIAKMNRAVQARGGRHARRESIVSMCCNYLPGQKEIPHARIPTHDTQDYGIRLDFGDSK